MPQAYVQCVRALRIWVPIRNQCETKGRIAKFFVCVRKWFSNDVETVHRHKMQIRMNTEFGFTWGNLLSLNSRKNASGPLRTVKISQFSAPDKCAF